MEREHYLDEWMTALEVTGASLAAELGSSGAAVSRYRNGRRKLHPALQARIAGALTKISGIRVSGADLLRRPGRQSVDAILKNAPDRVYEATRDLALKLTKKS